MYYIYLQDLSGVIAMYDFLEGQFIVAKETINYFFIKIITKIFKALFKLSICLIINSFISLIYINIISLLYIIYTMYNTYKSISYYKNIIGDIREKAKIDKFYFEMDFTLLRNCLLGKEVNYGK